MKNYKDLFLCLFISVILVFGIIYSMDKSPQYLLTKKKFDEGKMVLINMLNNNFKDDNIELQIRKEKLNIEFEKYKNQNSDYKIMSLTNIPDSIPKKKKFLPNGDFIIKLICFIILETGVFVGTRIMIINLETIGLNKMVYTSIFLCLADFISNFIIFFFFHRAPRKRTLMIINAVILFLSIILFTISIYNGEKKTKWINLFFAFIMKACFCMNLVMTLLFISKIITFSGEFCS